ncbi:MAG: aminotransferase class I/II-fold pyridoxal phosphate-dependent enzyme, partial [Pseudomonadales bacterium]|nr:aminotransferase class I/II-fold pyridoxal phosphate-dependent enzyme [Pseudomonadales bacterium]
TNENPYPPSPAVQKALAAFNTDHLRRYPQPTADGLRRRLADLHETDIDHIVVTHGGDEALRLSLTTFVEPGQVFGMLEPSYSLYEVLAAVQDARTLRIPLDDSWDMPRDLAQQLNEAGTSLACIVNPHAPSGTLTDVERISRLANDFRGVLLVDEAYADFVDPALRYDLARLVGAFDNLLILRTFSKGYGLAGLRLGYLLGSPGLIAPILHKTRDSYNIDQISQVLGEAAIEDQTYARETWRNVRQARRQLREALLAAGFKVTLSQTNFLLAEVPLEFPLSAFDIYSALKAQGILVRHFNTPLLEDKLRITVGTEAQNAQLMATLNNLLDAAMVQQR